MEASRLNIVREKSPTLIFKNNALSKELLIGRKQQLDVDLEIVGQALEMDEQGNEVMRYTLKVVKASLLNVTKARHDATDRERV